MKTPQRNAEIEPLLKARSGETNRQRLERVLRLLIEGELTFPSSVLVQKRQAKSRRTSRELQEAPGF